MAEIITTIIDIVKKADFSILFKNTMQCFSLHFVTHKTKCIQTFFSYL